MRKSWLSDSQKPLIVAHRGSSAHAPENTLAAFERAIAEGADALEFDVRLSGDHQLVVCHDRTIDRCSDGSGKVSALTVRDLQQYSAGAWFGRAFAGEKIPTLETVLARFADRIAINIELKSDHMRTNHELVDRCCNVLESFRLSDSVLVTSFHHSCIARFQKQRPGTPAGLLLYPFHLVRSSPARLTRRYDVQYLVAGSRSLRKSFVEEAHRRGLKVGEFTVNSRRRMERSIRFVIDAVITDHPFIMKKHCQ